MKKTKQLGNTITEIVVVKVNRLTSLLSYLDSAPNRIMPHSPLLYLYYKKGLGKILLNKM